MEKRRWWIEMALYGSGAGRRFTQDGPVLPDVWLAYLEDPRGRRDLLIEPWLETPPFVVVQALSRMPQAARVTYNRTMVVASLTLKELIEQVLPMAGWYRWVWRDHVPTRTRALIEQGAKPPAPDLRLPTAAEIWNDVQPTRGTGYLCPRLLSFVRVVGLICDVRNNGGEETERLLCALRRADGEERVEEARRELGKRLLDAFVKAIGSRWPAPGDEDLVYSVNRNRTATLALQHSVRTVKGDAARRLFSVDCSKITWAVIDSGIDAEHPAFLRQKIEEPAQADVEGRQRDETRSERLRRSRVRETYDFSNLRDLLLGRSLETLTGVHRLGHQSLLDERRRHKEIRQRLSRGRAIDWELLRPFLRVPHDEGYSPPENGHGTHVAGILGADWDRDSGVMHGMCPDINLIDVRILKRDGTADEFAVSSAMQFLRHINSQGDRMAVHGANVSLSLLHDAANYACGRTPICEEAERTVASGIVVVAAAGNQGYRRLVSDNEEPFDQFCAVSITDPGNAECVITVGSTHRLQPHAYGVSYFSSRGPTGDGRHKPDLVAPGEKIYAPTLGGFALRLDGTSMAAPHVSGAAAMIMARHSEFVGRPARIKQILCSTATDLGRERYFQGAGLVDVLRALQSV